MCNRPGLGGSPLCTTPPSPEPPPFSFLSLEEVPGPQEAGQAEQLLLQSRHSGPALKSQMRLYFWLFAMGRRETELRFKVLIS